MTPDMKIKEIRDLATETSKWYAKNIKSTLEIKCAEINTILKNLAEEHAPEFHLVHQNESSKKIDLWVITSRVKGESNLAEKIIRNQQFYKLKLEPHATDAEKEKALLENNDDIIGLRYLVSLSCDCDSIFDMICTYYSDLQSQNIIFNNLDHNPELMHNGRKIYRLKGCYENKYPFELQIKSKIDSAWGDEEHMLFYKESKYSYIQKSQRAIMNQVGELLEEADKLMVLIRHSHDELTQDELEEMEFYQKFDNRYAPYIKQVLSNTILIKQYRKAFYYYYKCWGVSTQDVFLRKMEENTPLTSIQTFNIDSDLKNSILWKNYEKMKDQCLEYILAEHISSDWMMIHRSLSAPMTISRFEAYISRMTECICNLLLEGFIESDNERKDFSKWLGVSLKNALSQKQLAFQAPLFLINANQLYMIYSYWKALNVESYSNLTKNYKEKIDSGVIKYMLNPSDNSDLLELRSTILASPVLHKNVFNRLLSPEFVDEFQAIYQEKAFTSTGKKMKANVLVDLFNSLT